MIDETSLIGGGDSGCVFFLRCLVEIVDVFLFRPICSWTTLKKKPVLHPGYHSWFP